MMENNLSALRVLVAGDLIQKQELVQMQINSCERLGALDKAAQLESEVELLEEQIAFRLSILGIH